MANLKIDDFIDVESIDGTELMLISKNGTYRKTTIEEIRNLAEDITNSALADLVGKVASAADVKNILNNINTILGNYTNSITQINASLSESTQQISENMDKTYTKMNYANSISRNGCLSNFIKKMISGATVKIASLGDSITDCGNVTQGITGGASIPSKGWFPLVTQFLQGTYASVQATNRGVGGQSVEQAFARIATQIIPFDYDLIFVELGTNDWNYGTPLATFETNYRNLITELVNTTRADILCIGLGWFSTWNGPSSFAPEWQYNQIIRKIALEFGIGYVDTRNAMMCSNKAWADITLTSDPVHPNDAGHEIWANEVITWVDFQGYLIENDFRNKNFESFIIPDNIRSNKSIVLDSNSSYYKNSKSCYIASSDTTGEAYLRFYGSSIKLIYTKAPTYGIAKIYIDGGATLIDEVDCYSPTTTFGNIREITGLSLGWHFISITTTTKNASSTGYSLNLEGVLLKNIKKEENLAFSDGVVETYSNIYYEEPFASAVCYALGYGVVGAITNKNITINTNPVGQGGYLIVKGY